VLEVPERLLAGLAGRPQARPGPPRQPSGKPGKPLPEGFDGALDQEQVGAVAEGQLEGVEGEAGLRQPPPRGGKGDPPRDEPREGGLGGPELVVDLLDDVTQGEEDVEEAVD